jgi:UDP-2,3-diacylglucosamine pyrophosphatase LpxH
VLKASGLAAGATALGVAAESVVAQDGAEHYMFASDVHLGSPFSNAGKFEEFLNNEVPSVDPDVLVLNGDVFEMWFRGMSATLLQYTNIASTVEEIHQNGTEVVLTAGNHDRRLITIGEQVPDAVTPGAPWQIGNDFFFESGGRSFVATHGDSGDPLQVNPLSNLLCATSDSTGGLLVDLYNWFTGTDSGTAVGSAGPETVTTTDPEWQTTTFDGSDSDSVVLTSPVESTGGPPVQARVKHGYSTASWNPNSVDIRVESWTPFGRVDDPDQTVHCAVLETGRHAIGRNDVAVTGRTVAGGEWTTVTFDEQFDDRPVVFTEVQSTNVDDEVQWTLTPSRSTVRNVTKSGFEVRVHEPDDETPAQQEVAFVAVEPGRSIHGDGIAEVATTGIADDTWQTVTFEQEFDDVSVLLAAVQTDDGTPVIPQYRNLDSGSVELSFRTTSGQFTGSATVNYLVLGDTDTFYASTGGSVGASGNSSQQVQQQWQEIIESADVIDASEMPDQPPGMAGARSSRFSTRASTAQNLLDIYPDAFVVFGHTHVPTVGNRYVNSGAWTSRGGRSNLPENTYIEIDSGDITVWNWQPTGREILFDP